MKQLLLAIIPILMVVTVSVSDVYAGGPRLNYPEDGEASPEENDCHLNGYDSGFAGKYNKDRADECQYGEKNHYNFAWDIGCEDRALTGAECGKLINNPVEIKDYGALQDENESFCYNTGQEDGEAGKPYNEALEDGCYEFGGYTRGYTPGYQSGCEKHSTESTCELVYEDKNNYCPKHPDVSGCVDFLHNATNKAKENPDSVCAGMGDPRPNIVCFQEQNAEWYCLGHDNPTFCKTIGDLCDEDGFVKPEYPYCKGVTD